MGIRGLTTFIQSRSHMYLEKHELHGCSLVVDGNSIASQLYKWHCKSNDCFGGDYDKYGNTIKTFFGMLSQCNIIPYVILDGGYEKRKIKTVISRMKSKIKSATRLNSATEGSTCVFPLFLRELFVDILLDLKVKIVRCEFEGDTEIASIAKHLDCPVLSYDSDFYIFDAPYIPFSTLEFSVKTGRTKDTKQVYNYMKCEIYKIDKFLNSFGGMEKSNLPILAVVLGNDYVRRSVFSAFFNNLKIQKCRGIHNEQHKLIKSVIIWLKNETLDSAIRTILSRYKTQQRRTIAHKIKNAIKGYYFIDSTLLEYLSISPNTHSETINMLNDVEKIGEDLECDNCASEDDLLDYNSGSEDNSESETDNEVLIEISVENKKKQFEAPEVFKEKYRRCLYPSCFMDMITNNVYYCIPQVEEYSFENSHVKSFAILASIHKILTGNSSYLVCIGRNTECNISRIKLDVPENHLPTFQEIQKTDVKSRGLLLLKILSIDAEFMETLQLFPESMHIFMISLKYSLQKSIIDFCIFHALLLCNTVLNFIDKKVGFYRESKIFEKKFSGHFTDKSSSLNYSATSFKDASERITFSEAVNCLKSLISYFQMDAKMRVRATLFDRIIVHRMAEYQSCLLHIKYLNSILNFPFSNFLVSDVFDGTFVYNLTVNLRKRNSIDGYMELLLKECPLVLHIVKYAKSKVCNVNFEDNFKIGRKRRRKKKKTAESSLPSENEIEMEDCDFEIDPNNKFSLLTVI